MQSIVIEASPSFAYQVRGGLWIGSAPPTISMHEDGRIPALKRFDTIVLCAAEYQPDRGLFPVRNVVYAPMEDVFEPISEHQVAVAMGAAKTVVQRLNEGKRVLVTCLAGRNRSGLVCAIALCFGGKRMVADEAVRIIRAARGHTALTNPFFVEFLKSLTE